MWAVVHAVATAALVSAGVVGCWTLAALYLHATRPAPPPDADALKRLVATRTLAAAWGERTVARRAELAAAAAAAAGPPANQYTGRLTALVTRDFVASWAAHITADPCFTAHAARVVHDALDALVVRARHVDLAALIVGDAAPALTAHVAAVRRATRAIVRDQHQLVDPDEPAILTASDALDALLARHYGDPTNESNLHPAALSHAAALAHLRTLANDMLLPSLLTGCDELGSPLVRTLLRDVLAGAVLKPTVDALADPHLWNSLMDTVAGKALRELHLVIKFRAILRRQTAAEPAIPFNLTAGNPDELLRALAKCRSLLDAQRLRSAIVLQLRRARLDCMDRDPDDHLHDGRLVRDLLETTVPKLLKCKTAVDMRIHELGGPPPPPLPLPQNANRHITLTQLLSSPASGPGLSHFMEFLEQQSDGSARTALLQFWLMAESFRHQHLAPAEQALTPPSQNSSSAIQTSLTAKDDFAQIYAIFFAPDAPRYIPLPIDLSLQLSQLVAAESSSTKKMQQLEQQQEELRPTSPASPVPPMPPSPSPLTSPPPAPLPGYTALLDAQRYAFQQLDAHDYPAFMRSDLYLSLLDDTPTIPHVDETARPHDTISETASILGGFEEPLVPAMDAVEAVEDELRSILEADYPASRAPSVASVASVGSSTTMPVTSKIGSSTSLGSARSALREELDKLAQQEAIVDSLLSNAKKNRQQDPELLKILEKSKSTIRDEIRELLWLEIQDEHKSSGQSAETMFVSGKCTVTVLSNTLGTDPATGKEYALYVIEVRNPGTLTSWIVLRRFSEFVALHNLLRRKYPSVSQYELPAKTPHPGMLRKSMANARQAGLARYLQQLVMHPEVCSSAELRQFLCKEQLRLPERPPPATSTGSVTALGGFVKQLQRRFMDGLDAALVAASGTGSMLSSSSEFGSSESLAASVSSVGAAAAQPMPPSPPPFPASAHHPPSSASDVFASLFLEVFDLRDNASAWLRRHAVRLVLQQVLGETIDRKLDEIVARIHTDAPVYFDQVCELIWPGGELRSDWSGPSSQQIAEAREGAAEKLGILLPEILGGFVGRQNAKRGAARLVALVQNPTLNRHMMYTLLDMVVDALVKAGDRPSSSIRVVVN